MFSLQRAALDGSGSVQLRLVVTQALPKEPLSHAGQIFHLVFLCWKAWGGVREAQLVTTQRFHFAIRPFTGINLSSSKKVLGALLQPLKPVDVPLPEGDLQKSIPLVTSFPMEVTCKPV